MKPRAASLRFEIVVLGHTTLAARMLIDAARHRHAGDEHDQHRAPDAASAVLELVIAHVHLLDQALSGDFGAEILLEHFNAVTGTAAQKALVAAQDLLLHLAGQAQGRKP